MDDNFEDDDFVSDHLEEDDEEWDEWTPNDDDAFDFESWNNAISDNASFEPIERDHGVTVDDADDIYGASTRARRLAGGLITSRDTLRENLLMVGSRLRIRTTNNWYYCQYLLVYMYTLYSIVKRTL